MRKLLLFAALIVTTALPARAANIVGPDGAPFDHYLLVQEAYGFSGAALVARGDHIVLAKGYGLADRARNARFDERTRMNVASLTKAYTATIILRLEQDGLLKTTDTLGDLLKGTPPDKRDITVEQLLTHTAGLSWDPAPRGKNGTRDDVLAVIFASKLRSQPGARFAYSNSGYQLLAIIAEIKTGRSYGELVQQYIARPAHAQDTGIIGDERAKSTAIARGYNEWKDMGTWRDWNDGWRSGSGDVVANLIDVWKWQYALRAGKLIAPELVQRMFKSHVKSDEGGYGYGWYTRHTERGDSLIYHGGDNAGYHTELRWYPGRDLTIIVFTNLELYDESGSGLGLHKRIIASALERIDRGEDVPVPPVPYPMSGAELAAFTKTPPFDGTTVAPDGMRLRICADSQDAINQLLGLNDARLADCNEKSRALLDAVATRDSSAVRRTLDKGNANFVLGYAFAERDDMEKQYGKFKSAKLCGSKPLPWDDALVRTFALLTFERKTIDYQFTWKGDSFYETLSDTGAPHALMLPMVPVGENEFVVWDLVGRRGARLRYEGTGASVHLLDVTAIDLLLKTR